MHKTYFKMMGKKIFTILRSMFCLSNPMAHAHMPLINVHIDIFNGAGCLNLFFVFINIQPMCTGAVKVLACMRICADLAVLLLLADATLSYIDKYYYLMSWAISLCTFLFWNRCENKTVASET